MERQSHEREAEVLKRKRDAEIRKEGKKAEQGAGESYPALGYNGGGKY